MATVEERLAAIEARLGVSATAILTPPITVGELTDVPAPGSQLAAQWAQEVSGRIAHRYPNRAALDGWAASAGSLAVTLDDNAIFRRKAGYWSRITPYLQSATITSYPPQCGKQQWTNIISLTIPSDPAPRLVDALWWCVPAAWEPYGLQLALVIDGNNVAQGAVPTVLGDSGGLPRLYTVAPQIIGYQIPANKAITVIGQAYSNEIQAPFYQHQNNGALDRLSVSVIGA